MSYLSKVSKMYDETYYCNNGVCKFYDECKRGRNLAYIPFRQDRVRIGKNYGNDVPKILFVGIEGFSCSEWQDPVTHIVKEHHEPCRDADNPHYNGVKFILEYLLNKDQNPPPSVGAAVCKNYNDKTDKFALTEFYRCAFPNREEQKKSGLPHTKAMQQNCQQILMDEIKILEPDILVIQASNWPKGLSDRINTEFHLKKKFGDWDRDKVELWQSSGEREMLVLNTIHGACARYRTSDYLEKLSKALDYINNLIR